jgi:hypothetical protein
MILGHVSRDHICVTPEARLGFRLAAAPAGTATLWKSYPTDIKVWVMRNGGLAREAHYGYAHRKSTASFVFATGHSERLILLSLS